MEKESQKSKDGRVIWALPPAYVDCQAGEMDIYVRFMRHIRMVPTSRVDMKILSAIQFTADMMDQSDALVAKTLVDLGLRAPRAAFPADFIAFVDRSLQRNAWSIEGPSETIKALHQHWGEIGDNRFLNMAPDYYALVSETAHS